MQLIETYKTVINHQLHWTLYGPTMMAEHANLKRLKTFIFPQLDKLEIGKEIPEELKPLANHWINLCYTLNDQFYPLYLVIENDVLKYATKDLLAGDQSEEDAFGYHEFMKDFS